MESVRFSWHLGNPFLGLILDRDIIHRDLPYVSGQAEGRGGFMLQILGCYINPTDPDENKRQLSVARFIEHLKYAKIIGADMVGTETGRYSSDFQVVPETYTEECYQLLLKSMREIVDAAEKLGVIVGVEAVHDHTLYSRRE